MDMAGSMILTLHHDRDDEPVARVWESWVVLVAGHQGKGMAHLFWSWACVVAWAPRRRRNHGRRPGDTSGDVPDRRSGGDIATGPAGGTTQHTGIPLDAPRDPRFNTVDPQPLGQWRLRGVLLECPVVVARMPGGRGECPSGRHPHAARQLYLIAT